MGLFLKSSGYYYAELTIDGKRIQKSLRTKSKVFAKDLYHVLLGEQVLQTFFPKAEPAIPAKISKPRTEAKKPSFIACYEAYVKACEFKGLCTRTMEPKAYLLKLLKQYNLDAFDKFTPII